MELYLGGAGIEAQFIGGEDSMMRFLLENINYPKQETNEGVIYAGFDVTEQGVIEDIKIMSSFDGAKQFEKEVIRVIKSMPNWEPAQQDGEPIKSNYVLPISFGEE